MGLVFDVVSPDVDETPLPQESPADLVIRLARAKAQAVQSDLAVVAADTVVAIDGEILGKPADAHDAARMLTMLSGRDHEVTTGVAIKAERVANFHVVTKVTFAAMPQTEIGRYIATGEPMDKAGAYGIQGIGAGYVTAVDGSYTNVVGLPLAETLAALAHLGISPQ